MAFAQVLEHLREALVVLLGEDFGGGHQHALRAIGDGDQQSGRGHHRLARADIALQEAGHRHVDGNIAQDFVR